MNALSKAARAAPKNALSPSTHAKPLSLSKTKPKASTTTMAPFTVSTRGVVLGGKAGSSLHSDLQELGRDDVKGALRVDASTNVKDTDLVFTTTDHTVRTVSSGGMRWGAVEEEERACSSSCPFSNGREEEKKFGRGH